MLLTLENQHIRLAIDPCGAQLRSLVNKASGQEYLWQPQEGVWTDSAPWLFPLIGQLRGGTFRHQGREYAMPMHGFAGHADFKAERITAEEAVLTLEATDDTLKVFPWRFRLETTVRLDGKRVIVQAAITNLDEDTMFFSIGAHPGVRCAPGDHLVLNNAQELPVYRLNEDTHLLRTTPAETLAPHADLTLDEALFDEDAMLLRGGKVTEVLLRRQNGRSLIFTCDATPWLGLWSRKRKGLNYVCIEPWFGVDDPEDASGDITAKTDIERLLPGGQFMMSYTMELLDLEGNEG